VWEVEVGDWGGEGKSKEEIIFAWRYSFERLLFHFSSRTESRKAPFSQLENCKHHVH